MLAPLLVAAVDVEELLGTNPGCMILAVDIHNSVVAAAAEVARPVAVDSVAVVGAVAPAAAAWVSAPGKVAGIVAAVVVEAAAGRTIVAEEEAGTG